MWGAGNLPGEGGVGPGMNRLRRLVAALAIAAPTLVPTADAQVLVPTDASLSPLAIKSQRVEVTVKDQLARTRIEQVFVSSADRMLEATYVFPIPDGIAVSEFALWMNGKKVVGEVLESDKARSIYEGIVARMRDPGLLEYAGRRLLRARVFPIPPRGEQRIEVEYGELTAIDGGVGRYTYPLATGGRATRLLGDLSVRVTLDSKIALKSVYSPTHKVSVDRKGDHHAIAGFEEKGARLDRDFTLFYTVSEKDVGLNLVTFRDRASEDGYFVLMLAPKSDLKESDLLPKDVVFVLDSSGSMDGRKMEKAKEAMRFVLGSLHPRDRFNIVRFSTGVESYATRLVEAGKEEIARARAFVDEIRAAGGTAIDEALAEALRIKPSAGRPAMIVFVTDGEPTVGETDPERILANVSARIPRGVRLFSFGIGTDLNAMLLDRLATEHGGVPEYATEEEEVELKLSAFASKINNPVMTDLRVDFGKTHVYDLYPRTIPDLFKGGQVTLFGRYKGAGGAAAMTLTGTLQGRAQSIVHEGSFERGASDPRDAGSFVPRLWATRKVGYLLDEIRARGEKPELRDEVVQLARRFGIMTPYTSYLVVEDTPLAANLPPAPVPNRRADGAPPFEEDRSRREGKRNGFGRVAGGGGAGRGAVAAPPPPAPAPAEDATSIAGAPSFEPGCSTCATGPVDGSAMAFEAPSAQISTRSGAGGVAVAKKVKDKREKEVLDRDAGSGVVRAGGRTFVWRDASWVDADYRGASRMLRVKYLSPAWFAVVRLHPELREAMSIGERVVVQIVAGKAVVVAEDGRESLTDAEIDRFFR